METIHTLRAGVGTVHRGSFRGACRQPLGPNSLAVLPKVGYPIASSSLRCAQPVMLLSITEKIA